MLAQQRIRLMLPLLAFILLFSAAAHASEFAIRDVKTHLSDEVYVLNARVDYDLSKRALEALSNGVPLTLEMDINVIRQRSWLPDQTIASLEQLYQINYHALSQTYLVRNLNSGALYVFPTRESAIESLGEIHNFPLLDANLIKAGEQYELEMRVKLDIERLPVPLKLIAYITPDWHLSSDWSTWSLNP